jgi:hypothetical protein
MKTLFNSALCILHSALLASAIRPAGRIVLHFLCAFRTHQWAWHFAGIAREILSRKS